MGRPPGWAAALTGRPPIRRDLERAFWVQIAAGLTSEDAAVACGAEIRRGSDRTRFPNPKMMVTGVRSCAVSFVADQAAGLTVTV